VPGSDSDFERSPEDRARAAAERAARRAKRAGKPVPPAESVPAGLDPQAPATASPPGHDAGPSPDDRTVVHETVAPAPAPAVAPEPVGVPPEAPPGAREVVEALTVPQTPGDEPAATPREPVTARHEPVVDPAPPPRREVPLASARPVVAAAAAEPGRRRGRPRGGLPVEPQGGGRRGPRWGRRLLALVALAAIAGALYLINATFQPFHDSGRGAVRVTIPEGADVAGIGAVLERRGVVASGRFFNANVTLTGRRGKLRPGDYVLRQDMSYGDASEALMQGPKVKVVETFDLTIPEGRSLREVAGLVADSPVRGRYARAAREKRFLRRARELGLPGGGDTLEGFLFPATYELTGDAGVRDLIGKQLDAFEENFASVPMARAKRRNLTRYDVLIIASMVEREAALSKERPLIAAVIHNRLRAGMPLGIDATIRYATDNWTRPIRVSELEADGPYNTRLRQGLPPTPIGNPGLDSLKAAANPADVDYLYYVVKPGTCGEHAFSATDAEFQRDSARYNAERAAAGGKSPTTC
jgi:uncharacterized YceG family protein